MPMVMRTPWPVLLLRRLPAPVIAWLDRLVYARARRRAEVRRAKIARQRDHA